MIATKDGLAGGTGDLWIYFAGFLGALGSFFSGSNTISNLTFGPIQLRIAQDLALPSTTILALQTVGAAMGNMVAIHNIVALCAVLGLKNEEGAILKKTFIPTLVYGIILAALAGLLLVLSSWPENPDEPESWFTFGINIRVSEAGR